MSRIVRHFLFASVIACHAIVTLCGPCLHALPGSSHALDATSKSRRADDPAQSRSDSADNCLVCQFVAQGQLPVEFTHGPLILQVTELVTPSLPITAISALHLPSNPRAPPVRRGELRLTYAPVGLVHSASCANAAGIRSREIRARSARGTTAKPAPLVHQRAGGTRSVPAT